MLSQEKKTKTFLVHFYKKEHVAWTIPLSRNCGLALFNLFLFLHQVFFSKLRSWQRWSGQHIFNKWIENMQPTWTGCQRSICYMYLEPKFVCMWNPPRGNAFSCRRMFLKLLIFLWYFVRFFCLSFASAEVDFESVYILSKTKNKNKQYPWEILEFWNVSWNSEVFIVPQNLSMNSPRKKGWAGGSHKTTFRRWMLSK